MIGFSVYLMKNNRQTKKVTMRQKKQTNIKTAKELEEA